MKFFKVLFAIFVIAGLFCSNLYAAIEDNKIIKTIEVKGNISVNENVILSQIKSKPGDLFLKDLINEDLRKIYSLGFFSDISIEIEEDKEGVTIYFAVIEKFLIKEINIKGNKIIRSSVMLKELGVKVGEVFNKRLVLDSLKSIEGLYKKKGFYNAKVDLDIESHIEERQVTISVKVIENKRVFVKEIKFKGNYSVPDAVLRKKMQLKEKWLFNSGFFNEEELKSDLERVAVYYKSQGYMNIKIGSADIRYGRRNEFVTITVPVEEGPQYITGIIEIEGNELFPTAEIKEVFLLNEGDIFSQEKLLYDQSNIKGYYAERGYIFSIVRLSTYINEETNIIDVTYHIKENELAYVEKIMIRGNTRTKDKVIRRNLTVKPLEPFNGKKLQRSKEKLHKLNYFSEIEFNTSQGTLENHRNLLVDVKEKKTGEFSFGGGYSSLDGMVGFAEISQNNFDLMKFPSFIGGGQDLRFRVETGASKKSYEISFTEPWFLDRPLSLGFDLYDRKWIRSDYKEERKGYDFRAGHPLGEYNYGSIMYKDEIISIEVTEHTTIDPQISQEEGDTRIRSFTFGFSRDTLNSNTFPTKGYKFFCSVEPKGGVLGGDIDIIKYYASFDNYIELWWKKWVLESRGIIGSIDKYDNTNRVPTYERFYTGGSSTVRGYRERYIGPMGTSYDPIGGNSLLVFNLELTFPLLPLIRGAAFCDAGNVWTGANDWELGTLKKGVGFGVRIKTPFGPVKLDYGFALNSESYEDDSRFHFSMGGFF
jgi:outer membrane protein insertion porin family